MPYVAPTTRTTGEFIDTPDWNQDIVENQNAAFPLGVGAWTAYTPTDSNITVGNGTRAAAYTRVGRTVHFRWELVFGSTTAFTAGALPGLPVTASSGQHSISAWMDDSGTRTYAGAGRLIPGATTVIVVHTESGNGGTVNSTSPFTWTTGDRLVVGGTYEAAS